MLFRNSALAFRRLRRAPLFFAVAVGTLAIGIGGNTAIFSVVHALLLEPLPYEQPEQLVRIYELSRTGSPFTFSAPNFNDLRNEASSFTDIAAMNSTSFTLTENGPPERVSGLTVTPAFFPLLGVPPVLGRVFREEESAPGSDKVAILSEGLWRTRFGGREDLIGEEIRLNGELYRVVGVMPGSFGYPDQTARIWTPIALSAEELTESRGAHYFDVIGRLKPGVTVDGARAEAEAVAARLAAEYPDNNTGYSMTVVSMHEDLVGDYRSALLVLLGAVGLVLLIACVNVANLFLVRALDRRRELAVRTALGAGRGRLAGEVLVESLLVALIGGALGLALAAFGTDALVALQSEEVPRLAQVGLNGPVLIFTVSVALAVGLAFGMVPAWRASRQAALGEELKDGRGRMEKPEHVRLRSTLVGAQVVLAVVLLGGAALLGRSFMNLTKVDHGFRTGNVLTFGISLPDASYPELSDEGAFFARLVDELTGVQGVEDAGAVFGLPLTGFGFVISVQEKDGAPAYERPEDRENVHVRMVTKGYLNAMDIEVVEGRGITEADRAGSPPALLLSRSAAEQLWPGESALGHTLQIGMSLGEDLTVGGEVVGIVEDIRFYGARSEPVPTLYGAHAQFPIGSMTLAVHTAGDPLAVLPAVRERLAAIDPGIPMFQVRTMAELASNDLAQARFYALLLGLFGAMALTLAAVGLYGIMAYTVSRRTREIGVRKALGADGGDVLRMVLRQALTMVGVGALLGLAAGFFSSRLLGDLLYQLEPGDPATLIAAATILVGVAAAAAYVPARRATRIDPAVALREDA